MCTQLMNPVYIWNSNKTQIVEIVWGVDKIRKRLCNDYENMVSNMKRFIDNTV